MTNTLKIPAEFKRFQLWACYDNAKQLISASSGYKILPNDFMGFATWEVACDYMLSHTNQVNGMAFVLPKGYICIDIERDNDANVLSEWLSLPTYIELSETKSSYHIFLPITFTEQVRASLINKITILSEGDYVCMTGDTLLGCENLGHDLETLFLNLYNKYFLNKVNHNDRAYLFTRVRNNEQITPDIVKNRIVTSISSNRYYSLMAGDYTQVGFVDKNSAIIALFNILIFWSSGNKTLCYQIFKESKMYSPSLDEDFNGLPLIDVLFKNALEQQKDIFDPNEYIADDYMFDFNKCITKHFKGYSLDDTGNALRLYDKFGDIVKYDEKNKEFYIYNKDLGMWEKDSSDYIRLKRMVDTLIEDLRFEMATPRVKQQGLEKDFVRNINYLSSSKGKGNCIEELKHLKEIPCNPYEFDNDNMLLNTLDGVVNLKNGQLLEHNKNFMMTKSTRCHIDTQNRPILFEKFMRETCCNDQILYDYLQRLVGYVLTGSTKEQSYYIFFGNGNNGKSVFVELLRAMLGDYAVNTPIETFIKKRFTNGGEATPDRARLQGARLVTSDEPDDNSIMDETFIKTITGGGVLTARKLHKDFYEFVCKFKLIITCNNMLRVQGTTRGDWRRIKKIDFNNDVPEEVIDRDLLEKLKDELPQILGTYALKGCIEWQENGLKEPESVKLAVNEFREQSNSVLNFVSNYTAQSNFNQVLATDIFTAYMKWARQVNENQNISQTKFGLELKKAISLLYPNANKINGKGNRVYYSGIRLLQIDEGNGYATDLTERDIE